MKTLPNRLVHALLSFSVAAAVALVGPLATAEARVAPGAGLPKPAVQKDADVVPVKPVAPPAESAAMRKAVEKTAADAAKPVTWPAPGRRTVDAAVPGAKADRSASARSPKAAPKVELDYLDQAASQRAGISGVLVTAKTAGTSNVQLSFDYAGYANAFGADWASRLTVVELPPCVLSTPDVPACTTSTPLQTTNNTAGKKLTTTTSLASAPTVLAITAGSESSTGDYAATPLSASANWSGGGAGGDFDWAYPLRVPPTAGGPSPKLAFQYSSQSVDGRTSASNNQASWVGDGFSLTESYVERKYDTCDEDGHTGKFDLCWKYDNATLVLNGKANELVRSGGDTIGASTWKLKDDDGSRVEKVIGTVANGDVKKEYWRVTTTDGTQYYFGQQTQATNSVWTVPVASDDTGEPCYNAAFASSFCNQAWRWNLDYVVDLHGNAMTYWYAKETNNYAKNGVASPGTAYVRGGYLTRIDYGQRADNLTAKAPQQVVFTPAERCLADCSVLNATTKGNWPDVPFDQVCEGTTACTNKLSPTFFSRKRLYQIQTQVWNGTTYQAVDFWQTNLTFPSTGDGSTGAPMWLAGISHTGKVGTAVSTPSVTFKGVQLANRVDSGTDGLNGLIRFRVGEINTETGGKIMVNYAPKECMAGAKPDKDTNTKRCYPVKWTPPREVEREDWFHKYVVDNVISTDQTGNGALMMTQYVYSGGAAWHYQETALVKDKDKTWSDWRGYGTVTTLTGDPANPAQRGKTVTKYFRGMDGDKLDGTTTLRNVDVTDSEGTVRADAAALAGRPREEITYLNSASTAEVSGKITDYVVRQEAAQTVPWGSLKSGFVGASATRSRTARDGGRPDQVRSITTEYDADNNLPTKVADLGDAAKTGDETCAVTNYAKKSALWLFRLPIRVITSSGTCDAASANPPEDRALTDVRTFYDGLAYGDASKGDPTTVQRLHHYTGTVPGYQTTETKSYDVLGRVKTAADALGRVTTTDYTPAATGPLTQTVVKQPTVTVQGGTAANFSTTTTFKPEWNLPAKTVDPNGRVTELAYDGLGRLTSVWLPSQAPASTQLASTKFTYTVSQTAASSVRTDQLNVEANGYVTSYTLLDSFLRQRQTQGPGVNGGRVITESRYDERGQVIYENKDIWDSAAPSATMVQVPNASVPSQTFNEYDGAGRVVKSTVMTALQPKWSTTTQYGGDTKTVLPPAGGSAGTTVSDVRGQVVEKRDYNGNTVTGTPDVTKYTFDLAGRTTQIVGSGGTWTNTYDLMGRKVSNVDPDAGTTVSTYDDADRVVSTTDSEQNKLITNYDALDRKTALYKTSVDPANLLSDWTYDKAGLLGQAYASTSYPKGKTGPVYKKSVMSRNVLYQPTVVMSEIPADEDPELHGNYQTNYDYKPDEKSPALISYSGGGGLGADDVLFDYNAVGLQTRMHSTRGTYVNGTEYNQFGDPTLYDLGSNADMFIANIYEDATHRLLRSTAGDVAVLSDHLYSYDPAGNVTKDNDLTGGGDAQCFDYDGHRRITAAWTPASADCGQAPDVSTLGGAAPYWQSWTYTATGLRKTQTDHSAAGDITGTYSYNTEQPHTLAKVTETGAGAAAEKAYSYDDRGNTITRPGQALTWNAQGKLAKLSGTSGDTSYVYDTDGNLLVRRGATETTLYLGELELTLDKATRKVTGKRQYSFGGQAIAVRSANGSTTSDLSWLVSDYHQTSLVSVNAATLVPTERYAKPFGDLRGTPPPAWPDDHGFLGKPADDSTGLTTVGAREYDPAIGRFISVDPLLDTADPQQMLGYTYANGNPVSMSDPTGLMNDCDCHGGGGGGALPPPPPVLAETHEGQVGMSAAVTPSRGEGERRYRDTARYIYDEMRRNSRSDDVKRIRKENLMGLISPAMQVEAALDWKRQVCARNCQWDHKPILNVRYGMWDNRQRFWAVPGKDEAVYYDIWSNIHYGYVGRRAGFDGTILQKAAALGTDSTGTNDRGDEMSIQMGIDLYNQHGMDVTEDQYNSALSSLIDSMAAEPDVQQVIKYP